MKNILNLIKALYKIVFVYKGSFKDRINTYKVLNVARVGLTLEYLTSNVVNDAEGNIKKMDFLFNNISLLDKSNIVEGMYNSLFLGPAGENFKNTFKNKNIVIISAGRQFSPYASFNIHPNIYLPKGVKTNLSEFTSLLNDHIQNRYDESGYVNNIISQITISVWDMTSLKGKTVESVIQRGQKKEISVQNKKMLSLPRGVRGLSTQACVANPASQSGKTSTSKKDFITLLKTENPKVKDFITTFDKTFEDSNLENFSTFDLETVKLPAMPHNNIQMPVCITHCSGDLEENRKSNNKYYQLKDPIKTLNSKDLSEINQSVTNMFKEFMQSVTCSKKSRFNNRTIFVHNLGGFDGIFIHRALVDLYGDKVDCAIDDSNNYVYITYKGQHLDLSIKENANKAKNWTQKEHQENNYLIEFKDSCRLFPVSLNQLCSVFSVKGKLEGGYNEAWNDYNILFDPKNVEMLEMFKQYALQDTSCLRSALIKARSQYGLDWDVDIIKNYSSSSLSLKIFRHNFMKRFKDFIVVLTQYQDSIIRPSYFGGATDYYKSYGKNLHSLRDDVNSLYPFAMKNLMPYKLSNIYKSSTEGYINFDVNHPEWNSLGFVEVEVSCPKDIKIPLLPAKVDNKTIFPTGVWTGTYFIPEIKRCKELIPGYTFKIIPSGNVSIFEGKHLFDEYIDAFYRIKAEASKDSPQRWMAKMHLNTLYGIFGRACEMNQTTIIKKDDVDQLFLSLCIKSLIDITPEYYLITYKNNVDPEISKRLDVNFEGVSEGTVDVSNNVAIASAVTAYARMHMMQFKVGGKYIPLNVNTSLEEIKSKVVSKKVNYFTKILNKIITKINNPHRVCVIYKKKSAVNLLF